MHGAGQRMTHVFDICDAAFSVPTFFEWQNRKQEIDVALYVSRAIRPPRPQLRADVINDADAVPVKPTRQPQIEIGPIDENCRVGISSFDRTLQVGECSPALWESAA